MTNVLEHLESEMKEWKQQLLSDKKFYPKWHEDEPDKQRLKLRQLKLEAEMEANKNLR